jgi:hypothetical protein
LVPEPPPHDCRYLPRLLWTGWSRGAGAAGLEERLGRVVPICEVCGRERPARFPRRPSYREARAALPEALPLAGPAGRTVAEALARRGGSDAPPVPARGLLGELDRRGLPASLVEEWIDRFLRAGWVEARWRLEGGAAALAAITVRDSDALAELADPGAAARRREALGEARTAVAGLTHPKARDVAALLAGDEAGSFPPPLSRALAALAIHAESGEILAERVFAARRLGDSKALLPWRARIERLLGPLAEIGLREGAALALVGGQGRLLLSGQALDLAALAPFVGLSRESCGRIESIRFPAAGLLVVENLTPFEACCRGEVDGGRGALLAWSGGYPGRAVRAIVERAGAEGVPVRVWADLDLDGVRIARLVGSWTPGGAEPFRMSAADLVAAPVRRPLAPRSEAAIRRDLEERPEDPLAPTLRAMLGLGEWVEQEVFL